MDHRLLAQVCLALLRMNVRYWLSVAPMVRCQLRRWHRLAEEIEDPVLRELALAKLEEEGFNAEAAAMLATLAPRGQRRRTVEAIVAVEIIYDYLDGLTESSTQGAPEDSSQLFMALTDAVTPTLERTTDYYRLHAGSEDCYLQELVVATKRALAGLPATATVAAVLHASATRGVAAQLHVHTASHAETGELERWAKQQASGTALQWREFLAGAACSVLAIHALIAIAAKRHSSYADALEIDDIYLSISVLPTILDSLIDHESDTRAGRLGYHQYYEDPEMLTHGLASVVEGVMRRSRGVPGGPQHVLMIVGILAYYASAPGADSELARAVTERLSRQLQPLLPPALTMMRLWRIAKRLRRLRWGIAGRSWRAA